MSRLAPAEQLGMPWSDYRTSQLSRVLGVHRGRVVRALRRLGLANEAGGVRGVWVSAGRLDEVRAAVARRGGRSAASARRQSRTRRGRMADRRWR